MHTTWILVANGHRARILGHDRASGGLVELAGFIYPAATTVTHSSAARLQGKEGRGHGAAAHGGTQFEPQTTGEEKAHKRFARQLAEYLNKGIQGQRCDHLVLIASPAMLGTLRPMLSALAQDKLLRSVGSDLTLYQGSELQQRVLEAVGPGV